MARITPHEVVLRDYEYCSRLAPRMREYIAVNRAAGKLFNSQARTMKSLDRYIAAHPDFNDGRLSKECVVGFISQYTSGYSTAYLHVLASHLRGFAQYLLSIDIEAYIYPIKILPKVTYRLAYIPTHEEIVRFMGYTDNLAVNARPEWRISFRAYAVALRFMYCCGMRISEPLGLAVEDVELATGKIDIIHSKGDKNRTIWVPDGFIAMLKRYDDFVSPLFPKRRFFLVGQGGKGVGPICLRQWFKLHWTKCFPDCDQSKIPIPHSLRHAMVIRRIDLWGGEDSPNFGARLPALSKFLGHTSIAKTMYYYHQLRGHGQAIAKSINGNAQVAREVLDALDF